MVAVCVVGSWKNAVVECLDYQIPVTPLNGDMQAAKRDYKGTKAKWRYASRKARLK